MLEIPTNERRPARILVVEDDPLSQEIAMLTVSRCGYGADLVNSGVRALDQLQSRNYDLVLMGLDLAEPDGFETSRRIRREFGEEYQPWIVALSFNPLMDKAQDLRNAGIQDYICKPLQAPELLRAVERFFTRDQEPLWAPAEALQEFLAEGERKFVIEFMDLFLDGLPIALEELERACDNADADAALRALHQLKGSSLQIGARRLGAAAREAESFISELPAGVGDSAAWLAPVRARLMLTATEIRMRRDEIAVR